GCRRKKSHGLGCCHPLFKLARVLKSNIRSLHIFPPGIFTVFFRTPWHLLNKNRIIAKGFKRTSDAFFEACNEGKNRNDQKNSNRDSQQRKGSTQSIYHK